MLIIIQARSTSTRFPNKVLSKVNGVPLIDYSINAAADTKIPFIVAIPEHDKLMDYLEFKKVRYFQGSELDVLNRFYWCAFENKVDIIIRLCADTLYTKEDILEQIELYRKRNRFTYGNGVFVMSFDELRYAWLNAKGSHREHVTTYLYKSVDFKEDLERSPITNNVS